MRGSCTPSFDARAKYGMPLQGRRAPPAPRGDLHSEIGLHTPMAPMFSPAIEPQSSFELHPPPLSNDEPPVHASADSGSQLRAHRDVYPGPLEDGRRKTAGCDAPCGVWGACATCSSLATSYPSLLLCSRCSRLPAQVRGGLCARLPLACFPRAGNRDTVFLSRARVDSSRCKDRNVRDRLSGEGAGARMPLEHILLKRPGPHLLHARMLWLNVHWTLAHAPVSQLRSAKPDSPSTWASCRCTGCSVHAHSKRSNSLNRSRKF